jgi:ubiquinone/menaquinone biosynthesis C-methylase UbiE
MAYDEKADLDQHRLDVTGLMAVAQGMGLPTEGYKLGLDIGGGLGLHAPWLQAIAQMVYVTDIIDYTEVYEGSLLPLMLAKYKRHATPYDRARTEYHKVDAQSLIYRDALFDFIFSVNAFEHIPNPRLAFQEMVRVSKPGALVVLQFDPLWHSSQGHHLWHLNLDPWAHLILSPEEFYSECWARGGGDAEIHIYDHETNRQPFGTFRNLFEQEAKKYFSITYFNYWAKTSHEETSSNHENYNKCRALGFSTEDLLTRGVQFVGLRS